VVLLKNFANIFKIPELTRKIAFTLGVLIVFQIGRMIPAIGVNVTMLTEFLSSTSAFKGFLSYFDTFSGGSLARSTIFSLGVGPYITASIIMQMLSMTVPSLEALMKEGDYGRRLINQYTRYVALVIAIGYSLSMALVLLHQNATQTPGLVVSPGYGFIFLFVLSLTAGAMFVMWLGEQISLFGIGNGSSMLIFAGIVATFPSSIAALITVSPWKALIALLLLVMIAGFIVFLEKGERKIPVQYARRIIGQRVYGGQSTYIPFKINTAGVMPVIFAGSFLNIPTFFLGVLARWVPWLQNVTNALSGGPLYLTLEFGLIIFFTFFYTAIAFNPTELADNMKKGGGFIPGLRPGKQTADYFDYILTRIGLVGAIYLGILAIAPAILLGNFLGLPVVIGGTSLLIMVGVALETSAQIESYLIEYKYGSFLSSGRIKNKAMR
jgi:preprotein translocase subunit SecY